MSREINDLIIFRKFARKATKNSHAALKACWTILFAGGSVQLLRSCDELIHCKLSTNIAIGSDEGHCQLIHGSNQHFLLSTVLALIYVLTFYRFYVGNIRVFDMVYDEVFDYFDALHEKPAQEQSDDDDEYQGLLSYSDSLTKWESSVLIITTLIIVFSTVTLLYPAKFLIVYFVLLVFDIFWAYAERIWLCWLRLRRFVISSQLLSARRIADKKIRNFQQLEITKKYFREHFFEFFPELKNSLTERIFPTHAINIWLINNAFCLFYIGFFLALYFLFDRNLTPAHGWSAATKESIELGLLWAAAGTALANCGVDIWLVWDFYNPKFSEDHQKLLDLKRAKQDGIPVSKASSQS